MLARTLEITTKVGCINRCVYCPQDVLLKAYEGNEYMTKDNFKIILEHTPKDIQIDFTGFCEPFLNPWASWMMQYAIKEGYKVVLITTLTGFTENDARMIDGMEFDSVMIHEFEGVAINYDLFESKVKILERAIVTNHFERFKLGDSYRWSRAGNLWRRVTMLGEFECGWTGKEFYRNVVLPNGNVYLCCMDYGLKHKLGNLFVDNYNDLNRDKIVELTNTNNSKCICRKCEIMKIVKK